MCLGILIICGEKVQFTYKSMYLSWRFMDLHINPSELEMGWRRQWWWWNKGGDFQFLWDTEGGSWGEKTHCIWFRRHIADERITCLILLFQVRHSSLKNQNMTSTSQRPPPERGTFFTARGRIYFHKPQEFSCICQKPQGIHMQVNLNIKYAYAQVNQVEFNLASEEIYTSFHPLLLRLTNWFTKLHNNRFKYKKQSFHFL